MFFQKEPKNLRTLVFVMVACVVAGVALFVSSQEEPKSQEKEQLPVGIEVIETEEGKIVRNKVEGYEVTVPKNMLINQGKTKNVIRFFQNDDLILPEFTIKVLENKDRLDIDQWLAKEHEEKFFVYYNERQKFESNNLIGYRIQEEGDPPHYSYYLATVNKIYIFSTPYPNKYEEVIKKFKTLEEK